ncbi:MAG: AraC family transcriptional regulator [Cyanobacteria bacterium P01_F01_bin.116]
MMQEKPVKIDCAQEGAMARTVYGVPTCLLSSHRAQWNGIYLEVHRHPPLETPLFSMHQHAITVPRRQMFQAEEVIDGKGYAALFHIGDISLAPANLVRQYRWDTTIETVHLFLEPDFVTQTIKESVDPDNVELKNCFSKSDPLVYQIVLAMMRELQVNASKSALYAESAATFLATHLLKYYSAHRQVTPATENRLPSYKMTQAIDYIQAHLTEDISLTKIANYLGISRCHLCRMFKQSINLSPYQYVLQQRVERAKLMLQERKLDIGEIAIVCGFAHQSHFSHHFKRITGVTPKVFASSP